MLEFNKEHKKADLSNVDINAGKYKRNGKIMLAGILLSTIVLFSGCGKVNRDSETDLNRAMVSIGDEYVVVDIDGWNILTESNTELKLTDGTTMTGHPSDIKLYNNKSEIMQKVEDSISPIKTDIADSKVEDSTLDRALVLVGDDVMILEITGYTRWSDVDTMLKLADGTKFYVHPMDLILFSSKSSVMSQVQEQVLGNNNSKTR